MDEKESKELIQHKIIVEDEKEKKEVWESCCIRTNPHAVAYIGQICIFFVYWFFVYYVN